MGKLKSSTTLAVGPFKSLVAHSTLVRKLLGKYSFDLTFGCKRAALLGSVCKRAKHEQRSARLDSARIIILIYTI
ncbi:hypothetical protein HanRHA438_Chr16g0750581 [Helianthus annuus]|nr:hypothetical protein HanIR_Chr16g0802621 [Helianthus annuus]KAJ0835041.1 hypothetical protein HanRHA438_Chr16g0750581 [Helianthus annuus]